MHKGCASAAVAVQFAAMVTTQGELRKILGRLLSIAIASVAVGCTSDPAMCPCEDVGACSAADDAGADAAKDAAADADLQSVESFCSSTMGFQVGLYDQCCTDEDKGQGAWSFLRGVADALSYECNDKLKKSAERGRISIEPAAASSCADAFQAAYAANACGMIWTGIAWEQSTCRAAVVGHQADGEPCRYRYECADGLFCYGYSDGVDGTCAPPPEGGACRAEETLFAADDVLDSYLGNHPSCATGHSCQHTSNYGFCAKTVPQGGNCVYDQDCNTGLKCHLGQCGTAGPAGAGAPCMSWSDCAARLLCVFVPGAAEGTCVERKAEGAACTPNVDECVGLCVADDGGTTGTCRAFCSSS